MRNDVGDQLVHFTAGATRSEACFRLANILVSSVIVGSGQHVRGSYSCVCFTEAPLRVLPGRLISPSDYSRYSGFGVIVEKSWLFALGGRPVIYQSESEFELLPESHRWRHVRYEPPEIDFSWEREWRIHSDELEIVPEVAQVLVPDVSACKELRRRVFELDYAYYDNLGQNIGLSPDDAFNHSFRWEVVVSPAGP